MRPVVKRELTRVSREVPQREFPSDSLRKVLLITRFELPFSLTSEKYESSNTGRR